MIRSQEVWSITGALIVAGAWTAMPAVTTGQVGQVTVQAQQDSIAKRTTLPPLALPDIVIFGRSTATAREGSKLFPADKRTVLDREVGGPVGEKGGSRTGWGGGRMLAAQEGIGPDRWARAYLRGGTYGELIAGGDAWLDLNNWQLLADLKAEGTRGHLQNSSSLSGGGSLSAIRSLGSNTELRIMTGYGTGRGEEWGVGSSAAGIPGAPPGAVRTWYGADYSVELIGYIRRGITVHGSLGGRQTGLNDDVRGYGLKPRSRGGWIEAGLEWLATRTLVDFTARTQGDRVTGPEPEQRARLSSMRLAGRSLIGESSSILAGLVWYQVDTGLGQVTRLWPLAEFTSQYSERFSMYVRYKPQIDYMTLGAAREQNPFVANSFDVVPNEERFNLTVGLRYIVALHMAMEFQVARRQFDRLPLWRLVSASDPWSNSLFILDGVGPVGVNETRLSLEGRPDDRFAVNGELTLRNPSGGGLAELPHIPRLQLSGGIDGQGPWNLELGLQFTYLGERFGTGDEAALASRRLPPAADVGIRVARGFGSSLTAWLELRNVLDQEITLWEGYPLPGLTTALGLSIRF